jgi:hypothetical protein
LYFVQLHLLTSPELILGNELNRKLASNMVLTERLVFYPNVSNTGNYRLNFDTALSTNINKWMAWNVGFSNRYLSNPVPGAKTNDLLFTAWYPPHLRQAHRLTAETNCSGCRRASAAPGSSFAEALHSAASKGRAFQTECGGR